MPDNYVPEYSIMAGAKLEYAPLNNGVPGTYSKIIGLNNIPPIGASPNKVDATTFDNTEYKANVKGLKDIDNLEFGFNLEHPTATANIKVIHDLKQTKQRYSWKLTYENGIAITFISECDYTFEGGAPEDLSKFTLVLIPENGFETDIPTTPSV